VLQLFDPRVAEVCERMCDHGRRVKLPVIFLHGCSLGPVCFTSNPCGLGVEGDY
jgi:hypothetical protein